MARLHPEIGQFAADTEMNDFLTEFQGESDRAAAVLGPAVLDDLLAQLIKASSVSPRLAKDLLGINKPLGAFGARISLAEAMGLISEDEAKDLNRLRDIRNKFAHRLHGLTFASQTVSESCRHFRCVTAACESNTQFAAEFPTGARFAFNLTTALLAMYLTRRLRAATPATAPASPW